MMLPMSELTLERLQTEFNSQYRENFEDSLKKAINLSGINTSKQVSAKELHYMQIYVNGDINHDELQLIISRIGEKTACNIFCNGNLAEFNDWRKDLKAIADDSDISEIGISVRCVTV